MIKSFSAKCANWLAQNSNRADIKANVLRFGLELLFTSLLGTACMLVVSLAFGKPWAWLLFLVGFAPQRTAAGGYHAHSHAACILLSTLIFSVSLMISCYLDWPAYLYPVVSLISLLAVLCLAPVEAANKKLSKRAVRRNRIASIIVAAIYTGLACILCATGITGEGISVVYSGIAFASVSLVTAKINLQKRRNPQ